MLYRIEIENFYSIRDAVSIDLRAARNAPFSSHLQPVWPGAMERAPKVLAFFGANGSGKSNVLRAIVFLAWFTKESFQIGPDSPLPLVRFLDPEAAAAPTRLAVTFSGPSDPTSAQAANGPHCSYQYELVLGGAPGPVQVVTEALHYWPAGASRKVRLFERHADPTKIEAGRAFGFSGYRVPVEKILRPNVSLISTLAQLRHPFALSLWNAASTVFYNLMMEKYEFTDDDTIVRHYAKYPALIDRLNRDIERIDLGVRAMTVEDGANGPAAWFQHDGLTERLPMRLESHGTRMFVRTFPYVMQALETGGVAVVDELDNAIHPLVLPEIVRWFRDPERNALGAQLWMTCQNVSLLEELEKEEVWFCSKDRTGRTSVFGLADVKNVRRVDNFYRKYLSGIYGAVPLIG
jgi:hypothetical protein